MKLRTVLMAAALVGIALTPVVISSRRLAHAESHLKAATAAFEQTSRDAQEIGDLRGREERVGLAERPTQDVIAQVNAVLAQIGVPTKRLKSLSPESDSALNAGTAQSRSSQYRRQLVRLVLEDMSVQEIGAFLNAWRQSAGGGVWTPSQIEVTHNRTGQSGSSGPSGSGKAETDRYDLTVLLSAIYVSQASKEAS